MRWTSIASWISSTLSREGRHDAEAQRQARAERTWWRAHRDARHLFSQELRAARSVLAHGPRHEVYGTFDGIPVRRLLLEKTRCHLYYIVLQQENLVRIVAVWGAMKGADPISIESLDR